MSTEIFLLVSSRSVTRGESIFFEIGLGLSDDFCIIFIIVDCLPADDICEIFNIQSLGVYIPDEGF